MPKDDPSGSESLKDFLADGIRKGMFGEEAKAGGRSAPSESILGAFFEGVCEGVEELKKQPSIESRSYEIVGQMYGAAEGSLPHYMLSLEEAERRKKKWWQWF
ncbi:hypothetical protein [Deinococcus hopiensis]|uniref:Uncharacterized protein n=1 Tax=Deinococcus hopiensis KR-140 TaxID=695939 RepID=A0A1W1UA73_9DEIO|nr:hypothetical protein [Deinococcus hopiensis]SMB77932.1 hypothetical protein SAMN00790413_04011 [Deinococcus hopiensis KR-140]